MKRRINNIVRWLAWRSLAFATLLLFGCATVPAIPVAGHPTDSDDAAVTATAVTALATIDAAIASQPMPMLSTETATPNLTATAERESAEQTALAVTLTILAPTVTPTPDLAATITAQVYSVQTAIAATLTSRPTATPTPNRAATATFSAAELETAIAATLTAQPTPILLPPTNTPPCQPPELFRAVWNEYQNRLGCPTDMPKEGTITIESFEGGYLVWIKATDQLLYVLRNNSTWSTHPNTWQAGMPAFACEEAHNYGFPVMGFGLLWCLDAEVKSSLGVPKDREIPDDFAHLQLFKGGRIFRTRIGKTFILFHDHTWVLM